MTPTKQTVYLPIKEHSIFKILESGIGLENFYPEEGYFFTSEQLNEYTQSVIKQALETAAEKSKIKREETHEIVFKGFSGGNPSYGNKEIITCDKQSITNTFEETYQKLKV